MRERPAGVIAFDDYPGSLLAVAIAETLGLPGPSLTSALICHHKAWSRVCQRAAAPEAVPRFQVIDPRRDYRPRDLELPFPFWLKPVKASMSYLGQRIDSVADLARACATARRELPRYTRAFDDLVRYARPRAPAGIAEVSGDWLVAEEMLGGRQCTLEGVIRGGRMTCVGVVDSIRLPNRVSFARFQYPTRLAKTVQIEMARIAESVLHRIGLDDSLFNIEFFHDPRRGSPKIIEINPRFSPQFSDLYEKVDGTLTHQYVVEMAAGLPVALTRRQGCYRMAASFVLRTTRDSIVRRLPSKAEIARLCVAMPGAHVDTLGAVGERLSDRVQDMYSFRYGLVHLGGNSSTELQADFRRARRMLPFELESVKSVARPRKPCAPAVRQKATTRQAPKFGAVAGEPTRRTKPRSLAPR